MKLGQTNSSIAEPDMSATFHLPPIALGITEFLVTKVQYLCLNGSPLNSLYVGDIHAFSDRHSDFAHRLEAISTEILFLKLPQCIFIQDFKAMLSEMLIESKNFFHLIMPHKHET